MSPDPPSSYLESIASEHLDFQRDDSLRKVSVSGSRTLLVIFRPLDYPLTNFTSPGMRQPLQSS